MFIEIEGIDASGKTTVSKLLAGQMEAVLYKTPPKQLVSKRDEIDANASPKEHYLFYLNGVQIASKEIWDMVASGKNVVCDRYWLSTYVYHVVMGLAVDINDFANITKPDLTILLLVSSDIQMKRFLDRGMSIGDRRMINRQADLAREYKRALAFFEIPQLVIDTDHDCPAEIVEKIKTYLYL